MFMYGLIRMLHENIIWKFLGGGIVDLLYNTSLVCDKVCVNLYYYYTSFSNLIL